jgi:hypothetical protein
MIFYVENSKKSSSPKKKKKRLLKLENELNTVSGYRTYTQKSIVFPYTDNKKVQK